MAKKGHQKNIKNYEFTKSLKAIGLYTDDFIKQMQKAEKDLNEGKIRTYSLEECIQTMNSSVSKKLFCIPSEKTLQ